MNLPHLDVGPTLSQRTYETILEAVQSFTLVPGECYSIQELTGRLGVSRTPLKVALRRLEQEGLGSVVPYRGACVAPIRARDVKEILQLRILLESYAAKKAAALLSTDELAQAERILEEMEEAYAEEHLFESAEIGHQFHQLLLSKVDNHRLVDILHQLDKQYTRIRHYSAELRGRTTKSIEQHHQILTALKAADGEEAAHLMADHLASVRENVQFSLFPDGEDQPLLNRGELHAADVS